MNFDLHPKCYGLHVSTAPVFNMASPTGLNWIVRTIVVVSALLLSNESWAQQPNADFEQMLLKLCRKYKVPSLTVAAVRSDEVLLKSCAGLRKRGTNSKVDLSDRQPIGSNGKSMTAVLAATLVESDIIGWDTTISEAWPKLGKKHLHPKLRDVTLNELLCHQSGLQKDVGGDEWSSFFEEKRSPAAERRRLLKICLHEKPKHKRGEFHYSNVGYVVAAAMLEKMAGKDFESMVKQRLFEPLKMDSAAYRTLKVAKRLKEPMVWGHESNGSAISPKKIGAENPSVYASAGTVHLTIGDYANYAQWFLKGKPEPVLSNQDTMDHLRKGFVNISPDGKTRYGSGWIHLESPWGEAMQHAGSNTNSFALIWILPEKNLAAIALTNTYEKEHFAACDAAIVELFKLYLK